MREGNARGRSLGAPLLRVCVLNNCFPIVDAVLSEIVTRCPKLLRLECYATAAASEGGSAERHLKKKKAEHKGKAGHRRAEEARGKGKTKTNEPWKKHEKILLGRSTPARVTRAGNMTGGDDGGGLVRTKAQFKGRAAFWGPW